MSDGIADYYERQRLATRAAMAEVDTARAAHEAAIRDGLSDDAINAAYERLIRARRREEVAAYVGD